MQSGTVVDCLITTSKFIVEQTTVKCLRHYLIHFLCSVCAAMTVG